MRYPIGRVFYIGVDFLEVYLRRGQGFERAMRFTHVDDGIRNFADYVAANPGIHSAVIVDVIEEEYRQERIPKVSASERRGLLERRMEQHFRGATFSLANVTGRIKGLRTEETVVMSALTNDHLLSPWLDQLQQMKVPVAGIYSAPYLAAQIVTQGSLQHRYTILVTHHANVGLRQTLIFSGHVLFSRLCPAQFTDSGEYTQALVRELEKTKRYISKLRLVPEGEELDVHVVLDEQYHTTDTTDLSAVLGAAQLHYVTPAVLQSVGRRKLQGEQRNLVNLLCLFAARGLRSANYAGAQHMVFFHQYRVKTGLRLAGIAAAVTFLALSLGAGVQIYVSKQSIEKMRQQTAVWEQEYNTIIEQTMRTDVPPQFIRDSVVKVNELNQSRLRLSLLLGGISTELRQYKNIEIAAIEWVKGAQIMQARNVNAGQEYFLDLYPMPGLNQSDQVVLLRGRVVTDNKGYTDIFKMLKTLTVKLEKISTIRDVQLVRLPIDKESSGQIDGRYNAWHPELQAEFVLRAVYHDG